MAATLTAEARTLAELRQHLAAATCSGLAFMYGQAVGWASGALPQLRAQGLAAEQEGWLGGAFCLGALLSSPLHGLLADARGRKAAGFLVAACFVADWVLTLLAPSPTWVLAARAVGGAGGAGSITVASMYSSEVAAPHLRSKIGGLMPVLYTLGIFSAYAVAPFVSYRGACALCLAVSVAFLPAWALLPESPAYLVLKARDKEALWALSWLRADEEAGAAAMELLRAEQAGAAEPATLRRFLSDAAARRGLQLGLALVLVQTFTGIFAVHSYAATIFERSGGALTADTGPMVYGALMVLGSLAPPLLADRAPRKVLLTLSCALLACGMAALGAQAHWRASGGTPWPPLPALALSASVFVYFAGMGSVLYVYLVELFADEMRGVASAMFAAGIWASSFLLLQFFEVAVEALGDHTVFYFFAGTCAAGAAFVWACAPETRGRSPQQVAALLLGSTPPA